LYGLWNKVECLVVWDPHALASSHFIFSRYGIVRLAEKSWMKVMFIVYYERKTPLNDWQIWQTRSSDQGCND